MLIAHASASVSIVHAILAYSRGHTHTFETSIEWLTTLFLMDIDTSDASRALDSKIKMKGFRCMFAGNELSWEYSTLLSFKKCLLTKRPNNQVE